MTTTLHTQAKEKHKADRVGYGMRPPVEPFSQAINNFKKVCTQAGEDAHIEAVAKVLGLSPKSSGFQGRIAFAKKLGIWDQAGPNRIKASKRGVAIHRPASPTEEPRAIFDAFREVEQLEKTWAAFKGKTLPQNEYLVNWIESTLQVPKDLKLRWAEYFLEAAEFTGLLHRRPDGIYQVFSEPQSVVGTLPSVDSGQGRQDGELPLPPGGTGSHEERKNQEFPSLPDTNGFKLTKGLSRGRQALIVIPEELNSRDVASIKALLAAADAALEGLRETDRDPE